MNLRGARDRNDPEINFIPLIDVLLVILIFLMVTTTYQRVAELQITLPEADAELERRASGLRDALGKLDFDMYEESWAHDRELFKALPGMSATFDRWRLVKSAVAADLLPIATSSRGDKAPVLILEDAKHAITSLEGVESAEVELTFDPPWTPERIDPLIRATLGI